MSKTNYLQTVKSDLQRTAGNRCAIARCAGSPIVSASGRWPQYSLFGAIKFAHRLPVCYLFDAERRVSAWGRRLRRRDFIKVIGSAVAAWPLAARARQPAKVYRIAIVHPSSRVADMSETSGTPTYKALFGELRRLGYVEGINLTVERYSGEGRTEHYAELASDVVRQKADLILVSSSRMVQNFKAATSTIPIVGLMADPVAFGIVTSLAHPGGNITGISVDAGLEIWSKRLEFLRETIQLASRVGFPASRAVREGPQGAAIREAARRMGVLVIGPPLEGTIQEAEYQRVFEAMTQEHADALIVSDQAEHFINRRLIVELAEKQRLPAIYPYRQYVELGGLMAYAIDLVGQYRRAADYIDQILTRTQARFLSIRSTSSSWLSM